MNIPTRPVSFYPDIYTCSFIHLTTKILAHHTITPNGSIITNGNNTSYIEDLTLSEYNEVNQRATRQGYYPLCLMN